MIDMTLPAVRENVVLLTLESSLAFHAKTGFWMGGAKANALRVCKRDGWSYKRTSTGALEEVIAIRRAMNPAYEPSDNIVSGFDGREAKAGEAPSDKARARARKAVRMGDKWRVEGRPGAE